MLFLRMIIIVLFALSFCQIQAHNDNPTSRKVFEENKGQFPHEVLYRAQFGQSRLYVEQNQITWHLVERKENNCNHIHSCLEEEHFINNHVFRQEFIGSSELQEHLGKNASQHYKNYIKGRNPSNWATEVRDYSEVNLIGIYPGIDMRFYTNDAGVKYDWIIQPGANPEIVEWNYSFVQDLKIINGDLHIITAVDTIIEQAPIAYQIIEGKKRYVSCQFKKKNSSIQFDLGNYNGNYPLIIDPILVFSSYTGSLGDNWGMTATPGQNDEFFAGGVVFEQGYPITTGAFQTSPGGVQRGTQQVPVSLTDIAISKFTPDGSNLEYSTYIGGEDSEVVHSIISNSRNELVLLCTTSSNDFPTTDGAYQDRFQGGATFISNNISYTNGSDIAVVVLNASGTGLIGSSLMGGSGNDGINNQAYLHYNYGDQFRGEVIVDASDNIFVASCTQSGNFPLQNAFDNNLDGDQDACYFSMNRTCSNLRFSSYLGGGDNDAAYAIKIGQNREIYVTGGTRSSDFPVRNGFDSNFSDGNADGFISRFSANGNNLLSSSFVGTDAYDQSYLLALDLNDNIYIAGQTRGSFPVSAGAFSNPGGTQFIQQISPDLQSIQNSTVFGSGRNTIDISLTALMVDTCGRIFLSGWGGQVNNSGLEFRAQNSITDGLEVTSDAFRASTDGSDFYFLVLEREMQDIIYGTFFGRIDGENDFSADHVDGGTSRFSDKGIIYQAVCAGCQGFDDFPTTPGAFSRSNGSNNCNLAAVKFDFQLQEIIVGADLELDTFGCAPYNAQFINQSFGANSYKWYFGDGDSSSVENPRHIYQDTGSFDVQLIALTDNSCLEPETLNFVITIIEPPIPEWDTLLICGRPTAQLLSRRAEPITRYQWNEGQTDRGITVNTSGIYSVTASESNCRYIDSFDVSIINPRTDIDDTIVCGFDPIQINIDDRAEDILWNTSETTEEITVSDPGLYLVSYRIDSCRFDDEAFVSFAEIPDIEIEGDSIICEGSPVQLTVVDNSNATISNFSWSTGTNSNSIQVLQPGSYSVQATSDSGCVDITEIEMSFIPNIPVNNIEDTLLCKDSRLVVDFSPYAEFSDVRWDDGDPSLVRTFTQSGEYGFQITNFCQDIDGIIDLEFSPFDSDDRPIYLPNAFTPNEDGRNDVFKPEKAIEMEIRNYLFMVFDRWGNKVYESRDFSQGWDGSFNGQEMDPAIFAYVVELEFFICEEAQTLEISGDVSLQK